MVRFLLPEKRETAPDVGTAVAPAAEAAEGHPRHGVGQPRGVHAGGERQQSEQLRQEEEEALLTRRQQPDALEEHHDLDASPAAELPGAPERGAVAVDGAQLPKQRGPECSRGGARMFSHTPPPQPCASAVPA